MGDLCDYDVVTGDHAQLGYAYVWRGKKQVSSKQAQGRKSMRDGIVDCIAGLTSHPRVVQGIVLATGDGNHP